nr:phosphoenolpyruvate--protein phosphotransferase [Paenibacillus hamazuiensis]
MKLYGIGASQGIAVGPVKIVRELPPVERESVAEGQIPVQKERVAQAFDRARRELEQLERRIRPELKEMIAAQMMILDDPELAEEIEANLAEGKQAEWAVEDAVRSIAGAIADLEDPYLKERAADVHDLGKRILAALMNRSAPGIHVTEPVILAAKDLTPSDTAGLDPSLVLGFATELGGPTSHSAIMARTIGIPALVGVKDLLSSLRDGDTAAIDAEAGELLVNPAGEVRLSYENKAAERRRMIQEQRKSKDLPAVTADGRRVELAANIGSVKDAAAALEWGAEGVGLFRTEFLYMEKHALPDENEQFRAYEQVVRQLAPRPVIFRTLDIGGDKGLPYLQLPPEENPFLGYRALRFCLDRPELFKTQLRAMLRASTGGKARIMFPMVATVGEWRRAKAYLEEAAAELGFAELPEAGIMIEIPAAAVMARAFADEADFFSIGSNDLIQYTMAADRGNKAVSYLYRHLEPAVLRLIAGVIEAAHEAGKWVGMCGEMAGDPEAIPLLLGLGLDEFSMSAASLPKAREIIRSLSYEECRRLAESALKCRSIEEVRQLYRL